MIRTEGKLAFMGGGILLLAGLLTLLGASPALAVDNQSTSASKEEITLSPAVDKIDAQPGQMKSGHFTVLNTGETDFSFIVYARPYSVETENYSPNYQDTPARSNLYRWVQFDTTEGNLAPGEKKRINYTVLVPENAEAGGHYGVLFAETVADAEAGQVIARNKRVGSIVRMSVGGDIDQSGKIQSQSISWLQTRPPLSAESVVSNDGNVDFDVETNLRVTTLFGRELYSAKASHVIYPDKPRRIITEWEGSSILGLYRVEQTVNVLGDESQASSYVLMIPRWSLMALAMAIVAGGVYVAYHRLR